MLSSEPSGCGLAKRYTPRTVEEAFESHRSLPVGLMREKFEVVMHNAIHALTDPLAAKDPQSICSIYEMSSQTISRASVVKADGVGVQCGLITV